MTITKLLTYLAVLAAALQPAATHAALPDPVRAMIEAAIATGDKAKVAAVVEIAKQTNPADIAEIDSLNSEFRQQVASREAAEKARKEEQIRTAGVLDNWHGKGQIGAFQSSGNSHDVGVSLALNLDRKGIDWQHKLTATIDYQRSNGRTSRERYLFAYEPRYNIRPDLFTFGLAQFERDTIQGFASRYALSGGLGYNVISTPDLKLSAKAGPVFRRTELVDGDSEDHLGGLAGLDFDWKITPRLTFTQNANMVAESGGSATLIVDSDNTTLALNSGLEAKISDRLSTRLSYALTYDSNPPPQGVTTDTMTRFTMVYGF
jgi:putative salt-induced outer membrane protein